MSTNTAMQQQVYPPSVPTDSGRGMMINSSAAVSAIPAWHPRPPRYATSEPSVAEQHTYTISSDGLQRESAQ